MVTTEPSPDTYYRRLHGGRWQVWCTTCGGEGQLYTSRYGGNDPDVWPTGPCPDCTETPGWMDWNGDDGPNGHAREDSDHG